MRRTAFTVGLGIVLASSGCVHTEGPARTDDIGSRTCFINMFADFVIQGQVQAAGTGEPIPHARVNFVDTGLDFHRGTEAEPRRVGTSNSGGVIDQRYHYNWCVRTSFDALGIAPPELAGVPEDDRSAVLFESLVAAVEDGKLPQRFTVEVRGEGFAAHRVEFDFHALPEEDGPHTLNLGTMALAPEAIETLGNLLESD